LNEDDRATHKFKQSKAMIFRLSLVICLFIFSISIYAQDKYFQKEQVKTDVEELQEKLLALHPGLDYFVPKSTVAS